MNLIGIQILTLFFAICLTYYSYICFRKHYFGKLSFMFWTTTFSLLIIITLFPSVFAPITHFLKIARTFDLLLVIGIFFLLTISFINFLENQKLRNQIIKLVQNETLNNKND